MRQLVRREQDEIGLHIHWSRPATDKSLSYQTGDVGWINAQLDHGVRQLHALGARPRAFRSGALLHVGELPRLLGEKGFLVDSSTLWGRANRLHPDRTRLEEKTFVARCGTLLRRAFGTMPDPYFVDENDVERRGTSAVVEFPIAYSLFDARTLAQGSFSRYLRYKALLAGGTRYLTLFFHIDELTRTSSGPDRKAEPDAPTVQHFRNRLARLQNDGAEFLTCSAARDHWLRGGKNAAQEPRAE